MTPAAEGWSVLVAPNPSVFTGRGTNTYVLGRGRGVVVIDPGPEDAGHMDAVAAAAAGRGTVSGVLLTHHHPDHMESARALSTRLGAPVMAHGHDGAEPPDRRFGDGARLAFAGGELEAVHTPGHCSDHLCFHWREAGVIFCGDLVAGEGFIVIDPPDGDMAQYLASLRRVRERDARLLLPGHGPEIGDPSAYLDRYIAHRLEREAKVLSALARAVDAAGGAVGLDALLAGAYDDVNPAMLPVARRSLLAHLIKLVADGRAEFEGPARDPEASRYRLRPEA